jgi:hypothetical protein
MQQRRRRYLSFRYLFPEVVAPWLQFKRILLRVVWFFTHPIDEFLDDVRDALVWPFRAAVLLWQWMVAGVREFFADLFRGVELFFRWAGRLPVWTGSAVAGVMGIILTLLLFLFPAISDQPQTLAISSGPVPAASQELSSARNLLSWSSVEPEFDPFAPTQGFPPSNPGRVQVVPTSTVGLYLSRLALPLGWDADRQIHVVSEPAALAPRGEWTTTGGLLARDGWDRRRLDRAQSALQFSPYSSRRGSLATGLAARWIHPEAVVDPLSPKSGRRAPSVVVEKLGPEVASVGGLMHYEMIVRNRSGEPLDHVTVREQVSDPDRISDAQPPARVEGRELVWDLASLSPGDERRLRVVLWPDRAHAIDHTTLVQVTNAVGSSVQVRRPRPEQEPEAPRDTQTSASSSAPPLMPVDLPVQSNPQPPLAEPEPPAPFEMLLPEPLPEVDRPADVEPRELPDEWPFDREPAPPPVRTPPPREEVEPLRPSVTPPPVTRQNPPPATAEPVELVRLDVFSPATVRTGEPVRTVFEVANLSGQDLTNLVLAVTLSDELEHQHGRVLEHRIPAVRAGETYRTQLTTNAVQDGTGQLDSKLQTRGSTRASNVRTVHIGRQFAPPMNLTGECPLPCPPMPCGEFPPY